MEGGAQTLGDDGFEDFGVLAYAGADCPSWDGELDEEGFPTLRDEPDGSAEYAPETASEAQLTQLASYVRSIVFSPLEGEEADAAAAAGPPREATLWDLLDSTEEEEAASLHPPEEEDREEFFDISTMVADDADEMVAPNPSTTERINAQFESETLAMSERVSAEWHRIVSEWALDEGTVAPTEATTGLWVGGATEALRPVEAIIPPELVSAARAKPFDGAEAPTWNDSAQEGGGRRKKPEMGELIAQSLPEQMAKDALAALELVMQEYGDE
jgi:hypothetical protein